MSERRSPSSREAARDTTPVTLGAGRFHLLRKLGAGGFGAVYEARDRTRDAIVALKVLERASPSAIAQLKREFRELADLAHPNLVRLEELHAEGDRYFFTMERVEGVDVRRWVLGDSDRSEQTTRIESRPSELTSDEGLVSDERPVGASPGRGRPDLVRLRSALVQIVSGLAHLHAHGKLHCDIKPSNVLVDLAAERVVLVDFGLVTDADRRAPARAAAGTPRYMSPEMIAGEALSPSSDLYSVGVIAHELLTGRPPFVGPAPQVLAAKVFGPAPRIEPREGLPADLVALAESLLARDPAARPDAAAVLRQLGAEPTAARPARAPFVGRARELEALERAAAEAAAGRAIVVAVAGPSGIGKTRLVEHALEERVRREPRTLVLSARCREQDWLPYKALDPVLDGLLDWLTALPDAERALAVTDDEIGAIAEVFSHFRELLGGRSSLLPAISPAERRRQAARALRAVLTRVARAVPLAIWIDDAQWGDDDSARLLADVLTGAEVSVLVVLSRRGGPSEASTFEDVLAREAPRLERRLVAVAPLGREDARALVAHVVGRPDDTTPLRRLVDVADGNPFLLVELAEHADRTRTDEDAAGEAVLLRRVAELPAAPRAMLETVVVAGAPMPRRLVAQVAGLSGDEELAALAALRAARFVEVQIAPGMELVEASHDRVRELVYAAIDPAGRRARHAALAAVLALEPAVDPETLSFHHERAGDRAAAAWQAERAGDLAVRALAFGRAAKSYRRALELGEHDALTRARLLEAIGEAHAHAGHAADAARRFAEAAVLTPQRARRLELQRRAATLLLNAGHVEEGLRDLREVLGAVGLSLPGSRAAVLARAVGSRAALEVRGLRFVERDASEVPEAELLAVDAAFSAASGLSLIDTAAGAYFSTLHLDRALRAGELSRIARAVTLEIPYLAGAGGARSPREAQLLATARELVDRTGDPVARARLRFCEGSACFLYGEWGEAVRVLELAVDELRAAERGLFHEIVTSEHFTLAALGWAGRWRELRERLPAVLQRARDLGDLYGETTIATAIGHYPHLSADAPRAAREALADGIRRWPREGFFIQHYDVLVAETDVDLYEHEGRGERALERVRAGWPPLRSSLLRFVHAIRVESDYALARALVAAAAARSPGMRRSAWSLEARGIASRLGRDRMPWARGLGAMIAAACDAGEGREVRAVASLRAAARAFDEAGCALLGAGATWRRATLEGDRAALASARERFEREGVRAPERVVAMMCPGAW